MKSEIKYQSTSEIDETSGALRISFFSNFDDEGNHLKPSIYATKLLEGSMSIDSVSGDAGDFIVMSNGSIESSLDENGEMLITSQDDEALDYEKDGEDLVYEE